jgi:hypothetical protein
LIPFFDRMRRIVVLFNELDRKSGQNGFSAVNSLQVRQAPRAFNNTDLEQYGENQCHH